MRQLMTYTVVATLAFCLGGIWNISQYPGFRVLQRQMSLQATEPTNLGGNTIKKSPGECPKTSSGPQQPTLTIPLIKSQSITLERLTEADEANEIDPFQERLDMLSRNFFLFLAAEISTHMGSQFDSKIQNKIKQIELVTTLSPKQKAELYRYYYADQLQSELSNFQNNVDISDLGVETDGLDEILGEQANSALTAMENQPWMHQSAYQMEQKLAFIEEQAGLSPEQKKAIEEVFGNAADSNSKGELAYFSRELGLDSNQRQKLGDGMAKIEAGNDILELYAPGSTAHNLPPQFYDNNEDRENGSPNYRRLSAFIVDREVLPHLNPQQREKLAKLREFEESLDSNMP